VIGAEVGSRERRGPRGIDVWHDRLTLSEGSRFAGAQLQEHLAGGSRESLQASDPSSGAESSENRLVLEAKVAQAGHPRLEREYKFSCHKQRIE
jgi:hypothetical protein